MSTDAVETVSSDAVGSTGRAEHPGRTPELPAVSIAGVRIDAVDRHRAARLILQSVAERQAMAVHLCNAYVLSLASQDREYAALLNRGDLNLADGAPVAWFARRAGLDAAARPSGVELLETVVAEGLDAEVRHYLYGSDDLTVLAMATALRARFPGVQIAVTDAPPFGTFTDERLDELSKRLDAARADVVWVGLGTPKQDDVVARLRQRFDGPIVPVGAAFDFIGGNKSRAPKLMRRAGLEWLHRLATEPGRLWKRYLIGNLRFLWALIRTGRPATGQTAALRISPNRDRPLRSVPPPSDR